MNPDLSSEGCKIRSRSNLIKCEEIRKCFYCLPCIIIEVLKNIMLFYNQTKGGVDVCDKMCKQYSVRSMVKRWPQVHFQNMLDVVGVNTFSLVCLNAENMDDHSRRHGRRNFLYSLSKELMLPFIYLRIQRPTVLSNTIIRAMERLANRPRPIPRTTASSQKQRCMKCREEGKMTCNITLTSNQCAQCKQFLCKVHTIEMCASCVEQDVS